MFTFEQVSPHPIPSPPLWGEDEGGERFYIDNRYMNRDTALELLKSYLKTDTLIKHSLATEAIMRELASLLGRDVELWGLTGLLHDLDLELTINEPARHALHTTELLEKHGIKGEIIQAIKAHNGELLGIVRSSELDFALACAETITGLVVATALVYPDKKLSSVKQRSILKRFKGKAFARSVDREIIAECKNLNLTLERFVEISLKAMQGISTELGL
ncbi:MAG: HDIG domain-containing metalloprotein [Candidatus Brocadiales bacterium]